MPWMEFQLWLDRARTGKAVEESRRGKEAWLARGDQWKRAIRGG